MQKEKKFYNFFELRLQLLWLHLLLLLLKFNLEFNSFSKK